MPHGHVEECISVYSLHRYTSMPKLRTAYSSVLKWSSAAGLLLLKVDHRLPFDPANGSISLQLDRAHSALELQLLACLGCIFWTTLLLYTARYHVHLRYFLLGGTFLSCMTGRVFAATASQFIFQYLFLGVSLSLVASMMFHWQKAGQHTHTHSIS